MENGIIFLKFGSGGLHIRIIWPSLNEESEELIRYAALMHNSVMTATSTEQWETSCLVNDAFGTTLWLFQDVSDVTFIVFHRVVRQRHLLRLFSCRFFIVTGVLSTDP
jgi:hypothetical protein